MRSAWRRSARSINFCSDRYFPESVIRNIIYQILQGLAFMHRNGRQNCGRTKKNVRSAFANLPLAFSQAFSVLSPFYVARASPKRPEIERRSFHKKAASPLFVDRFLRTDEKIRVNVRASALNRRFRALAAATLTMTCVHGCRSLCVY